MLLFFSCEDALQKGHVLNYPSVRSGTRVRTRKISRSLLFRPEMSGSGSIVGLIGHWCLALTAQINITFEIFVLL